jgi:hypothetical protein
MATELTFKPGRVPGIAVATRAHRAPIGGMSAVQRDALAGLIHEPVRTTGWHAGQSAGAVTVWLIATATALLWSFAIAFVLLQEVGLVPPIDALVAGQTVASHTVAAPAAAHADAHQSSATVSRTM